MITMTGTVTINAAFLKEIKEDDRQLRALLEQTRELFAEPRRIARQRLVPLLSGLRDQLGIHFALEEAYGYFDEPVSVAPNLSDQADRLRRQHVELYGEVCRLADAADASGSVAYSDAIQMVVRDFLAFYNHLQEHEKRENELIVQAYNVEYGVGD